MKPSAVAFRCPYCHAGVSPSSEPSRACTACSARHHAECWEEHGRCSACDESVPLLSAGRARRPLLLGGLACFVAGAAIASAVAQRAPTEHEHRLRALSLIEKRDYAAARAELSRAIELDRSSFMAWALRGSVRRAQGDTAAALRDLDEALRLSPGFTWAREERAKAAR